MKTPEEIKKELRNAKHVQCMDISDGENECARTNYGVLVGYVLRDAIYIYITQLESDNESKQKRIEELESRLAQVERERDAAVADLQDAAEEGAVCFGCKHDTEFDRPCEEADFDCMMCNQPCKCKTCERGQNYEWRGVCAENSKEE